ncbi:MAG: hypothetical protein LKJ69_09135 [Lactobacillus sp.]|jgi:hypothetical protein|nr:hypothetical protein [Lactobacillus sp.]MCI2033531.1 hypothetical protein [Lactobacillus sp.]
MARTNISNSVSIASRRHDDPNELVSRRFINIVTGVTDNQLLSLERLVNSFDNDEHDKLLLTRVDEINPG